MTNSELIEYYTNLLIIQYHDKEKARAHIVALITAETIFDVAVLVRDGFNINTAVGAQLDILGKYVGVDRIIYGTTFDRSYFGYVEYAEVSPFAFSGYSTYEGITPDVQFRQYEDETQSIYTLNDDEYRFVIKLKIIQNNSIPSLKSIDDLMASFFGSDVLISDLHNMVISLIGPETSKRLLQIAESEDLIPRPSTVALVMSFTNNMDAVFSYATYEAPAPSFGIGYPTYEGTALGGMAYYE